jgi:hypothetical protein
MSTETGKSAAWGLPKTGSHRVEWGVLWLNGRPGWPDNPVQRTDDLRHAQSLVRDYGDEVKLINRTITTHAWQYGE